MCSLCKLKYSHCFKWFHKILTNLMHYVKNKKKTLLFSAIANLQFNHLCVTLCAKNMQNQKGVIKHQPIVQMSSSLDQWNSFSLYFWWTSVLAILVTSWSYATLIKMVKIAILTNVACDHLVTNMVNMGGYQKHNETLVYWSKLELILSIGWCYMALFRLCMFLGQLVTKMMLELQISYGRK